jgi:hypothetical protein
MYVISLRTQDLETTLLACDILPYMKGTLLFPSCRWQAFGGEAAIARMGGLAPVFGDGSISQISLDERS